MKSSNSADDSRRGSLLFQPRTLNRFDAVMMIVGNIIGIGIFTTTGYIAGYLSTPGLLLSVWIFGSIYTFLGALTYAELATRFPMAGGDYHYLKAAYHPCLGFFFGWSTFTVTYTGSIATIAVGFSSYFLNLLPAGLQHWRLANPNLPFTLDAIKLTAILITVILTWINCLGIRKGAWVQNFFTVLSVGILVAFITLGFASGNGKFHHFTPFIPDRFQGRFFSLMGVAFNGVIFTFSGWTTIVYIAGEVRNPRKNIPLAMGFSVLMVAILYLLINLVYIYALSLSEMANVVDIGYRTLRILFGSQISVYFSIIIMLAVLSTLNSTILSGARIYFAMAREGIFFTPAGRLHVKYKVPVNSLWMQCLWSVVLILSGSFNQLLTYTVFVIVLFAFLSGVALFVLRAKMGERNSIYSVWGYPVLPAIYVLISGWVMINTLIHRPRESLLGAGIVLLGLPFYFYWKRRQTGTVT